MGFFLPNNVVVDVPHRISGFFEPVEMAAGRPIKDLARIGSRGGGPALSAFGHTRVEKHSGSPSQNQCRIFINGEDKSGEAQTTAMVFRQTVEHVQEPIDVTIYHDFDLPIACGYGASGAGAIGTALGLACVCNLPMSLNEIGRIAHLAEVMNKTGLGTVGGQILGGFSITTKAGFPFVLDRLIMPPEARIVCGSFGPLLTKEILGSWEWKEKIRVAGAKALKDLLARPTVDVFMQVSRRFVAEVGFLEALDLPQVSELMKELNEMPIYGASMNQLGQSVFAICQIQQIEEVQAVFEQHAVDSGPALLKLCEHGPVLRVPEESG